MVIPPNRVSRREDQLDRIYKTTREKYIAAITDIRECYERGQPVLVGTTSIENSEIIAQLLEKEKLPHQVLNAKQHAREADIVAQAGRSGMITIATTKKSKPWADCASSQLSAMSPAGSTTSCAAARDVRVIRVLRVFT